MNQFAKRMIGFCMVVVLTAITTTTDLNIVNAESDKTIQAPRIGSSVTWDCVYYGSYPQTEVTQSTDAELYSRLQNAAEWDQQGNLIIGTEKYRRIRKEDAASTASLYHWEDDTTYHYFRYEPIKWRVLDVSQGEVYLVSDGILDTQKFNQKAKAVSWKKSTIRSWLNGLGGEENAVGTDYSKTGFLSVAFTHEEQQQLLFTGDDKVELLAENQVTESTYAGYGFISDEARSCKSSDYAKAMGAGFQTAGFSNWWLATSGNSGLTACYVQTDGTTYTKGYSVAYAGNGVRAAIHLNCAEGQEYSYAGTVSSDGEEQPAEPTFTATSTPPATVTVKIPTVTEKLTSTPTPTEPSEVTDSPSPTNLPEVTDSPSATELPEVTDSPSPTNLPEVTDSPTPTELPEVTDSPSATELPEVTDSPSPTELPEVTDNPTPTETPEATDMPTLTNPPEVTDTPTPTVEPSETLPTREPVTKKPEVSKTGVTPTQKATPISTKAPTKVPTVKKGTVYKDKKTKAVYKVTKAATKNNGTVQYVRPTSNQVTTVTIPAAIKIKGKTYKVTSIGSKAFQKHTKLKKVVIGKNVSLIGKNAFYGCKRLKVIQIKTSKLTKKRVGKNAFKGIYKKAKIIVPAKKQKAYGQILLAAGAGKSVKITK